MSLLCSTLANQNIMDMLYLYSILHEKKRIMIFLQSSVSAEMRVWLSYLDSERLRNKSERNWLCYRKSAGKFSLMLILKLTLINPDIDL